MLRVVASSGRVGHIVDGVNNTDDGRTVDTLCGKTFAEYDVRADNDADPCSLCENKLNGVVESEPTLVLESDEKPVQKTEKSETKKDK